MSQCEILHTRMTSLLIVVCVCVLIYPAIQSTSRISYVVLDAWNRNRYSRREGILFFSSTSLPLSLLVHHPTLDRSYVTEYFVPTGNHRLMSNKLLRRKEERNCGRKTQRSGLIRATGKSCSKDHRVSLNQLTLKQSSDEYATRCPEELQRYNDAAFIMVMDRLCKFKKY